jgi:hypothetical protein
LVYATPLALPVVPPACRNDRDAGRLDDRVRVGVGVADQPVLVTSVAHQDVHQCGQLLERARARAGQVVGVRLAPVARVQRNLDEVGRSGAGKDLPVRRLPLCGDV